MLHKPLTDETDVSTILAQIKQWLAGCRSSGRWPDYETAKRLLGSYNLPTAEYERGITVLADWIGV